MFMLKILSDIGFALLIITIFLAFTLVLIFEALQDLYENLIVPTFIKIREYIYALLRR